MGDEYILEMLLEQSGLLNPSAIDVTDRSQPATAPHTPPVGSGPMVEQVAWPEFGDVPDCGVTEVRTCYDPSTGEVTIVWPVVDGVDEADGAEDGEGEPDFVVTATQLVTAVREYARVRIAPAPLILEPDQDWHLVNLPVIARTEPVVQEFSVVLLGLPVQIRAEPVSYSWDFGDGSAVLNTTDPGAGYPDQTIEHAYEAAGEYQITLITYWSGSFRVGDGAWIDIDGLGVTASTSPVLDLQTRTTRLVG
ncbi:PKD domain-containing protein [Pseudactinotalea sp. Z1739]|uniref:PKD domain-containing protein n=2 Tax=Actinomycetes TaxID=1760 RepID=UPI003C7B53FC